ncbi:MAG: Flp family type IVb pilin [Alphaproteobacteria bacterium]|nr:Flp family type IVb pilin [Alphaproteobacteria bacterium]
MISETNLGRRHNRISRSRWIATLRRLFASRDGAVGTEYGFLLAFIALVAAIGVSSLGDGLTSYFDGVSRVVESAASEPPNPLGGGGSGGATSGCASSGGSGGTGGSGGSGGSGGPGGSNGSNGGGNSGGGNSGGGNSNGNGNGNK